MFTPRYLVQYLAYADDPIRSYWDWLDEYYTYRGAWKAVQKLLLVRYKNNAGKSKFRILDRKTKLVTQIKVTTS